MTSGIVLGISLGFNDHAPEQTSIRLAFHQQATNQVGGDKLGGAGEESLGKGWEILGDERSGYGSDLRVDECVVISTTEIPSRKINPSACVRTYRTAMGSRSPQKTKPQKKHSKSSNNHNSKEQLAQALIIKR